VKKKAKALPKKIACGAAQGLGCCYDHISVLE
jgi:hypothetical protein